MALAFGPAVDREIEEILSRYPEPMGALIPVLYVALREFHSLDAEALELVARRLDVPAAKVLNTATFYTMLHRKPTGQVHLQVCKTVSCYLRGSDRLIEAIGRKLGIAPGEVSADGRFSLERAECLAACGTAPVMRVGGRYEEEVDLARLEAMLEELLASTPTPEPGKERASGAPVVGPTRSAGAG